MGDIDGGGLLGGVLRALPVELVGQGIARLDGAVNGLVLATAVQIVEQQREEHDTHYRGKESSGDVFGKVHASRCHLIHIL